MMTKPWEGDFHELCNVIYRITAHGIVSEPHVDSLYTANGIPWSRQLEVVRRFAQDVV